MCSPPQGGPATCPTARPPGARLPATPAAFRETTHVCHTPPIGAWRPRQLGHHHGDPLHMVPVPTEQGLRVRVRQIRVFAIDQAQGILQGAIHLPQVSRAVPSVLVKKGTRNTKDSSLSHGYGASGSWTRLPPASPTPRRSRSAGLGRGRSSHRSTSTSEP